MNLKNVVCVCVTLSNKHELQYILKLTMIFILLTVVLIMGVKI